MVITNVRILTSNFLMRFVGKNICQLKKLYITSRSINIVINNKNFNYQQILMINQLLNNNCINS